MDLTSLPEYQKRSKYTIPMSPKDSSASLQNSLLYKLYTKKTIF